MGEHGGTSLERLAAKQLAALRARVAELEAEASDLRKKECETFDRATQAEAWAALECKAKEEAESAANTAQAEATRLREALEEAVATVRGFKDITWVAKARTALAPTPEGEK